MKPKKTKHNGKAGAFNPQVFLDTAGVERRIVQYRRYESIYTQGDAADTVMYIQKGGVKLSVVNGSGREAVVAMFGLSCLQASANQTFEFCRRGKNPVLWDRRRACDSLWAVDHQAG